VINIINTITNYALGLLALTALIYLLYHGILMVTAAGDEERYNK
jgi:threonine/homoserine/homoserine lactone efflux protein